MFKRLSPVTACLIAVLSVYASFPLRGYAESSPCETLSTQTVKSPNGRWNAVTTEIFCENGYSFLSSAEYLVTLVNVSNPSIKKDVFAVNADGPITRPSITWSGNTTLKINTIHPYGFNLQLSSYNGISIVYTYRKFE